MMIGMLIIGSTLGIYLAQMLWENIPTILFTYQVYVFYYVLIVGFVSFVICYRFGPPQYQRRKNLMQWGLQLAALIAIFYSSNFQEATAGICLLSLIIFFFPKSILLRGRSFWLRRFPPKPRRLLSEKEYNEQGVREADKALEELRAYCNSPECTEWSTMLNLKNPTRFAAFIDGTFHIDHDEIYEYMIHIEESMQLNN